MRGKTKAFILGIIIILLIPILGFGEKKYEERDLLLGILEDMGASFVEGEICFGGDILDRFIGQEEIMDIGNVIREGLSIFFPIESQYREEADYWDRLTEDEGFIQLVMQGRDSYENLVTITISSYMDMDDNSGNTSLFINLINKEKFVEINDIIIEIGNIFDEYKKPVNITTCLVGTLNDRLNARDKEKRVMEVTKAIRGSLVEEYKEEGILSASIYTPYIEEHIFTGNNKMNLNIAIRFNEYEDKTYIWIGTPIITIGY